MDPEATLDIYVHPRDHYCFKCGARRVSRRAVRAVVFAMVAAAVLSLVTWRAVRRGGTLWAILFDVALALAALLTPLPAR